MAWKVLKIDFLKVCILFSGFPNSSLEKQNRKLYKINWQKLEEQEEEENEVSDVML